MKNQPIIVVVVLCQVFLGVWGSYAQQNLNITVENNNTSALRLPDPTLLGQLREIILQLEKNSPELLRNRSPEETDKILQSFLSGFNCELMLTRVPIAAAPAIVDSPLFPALKLEKNRIIYSRLDAFTAVGIAALERELKTLATESSTVGVIIDLRHCTGYDLDQAVYLLGLIIPPQYLPASTQKHPDRIVKKIIAVLIGPDTSGSAEFFARHLRETRTGLTFGAATAGKPFLCRTVLLSEGRYLAIPELPRGIKNASPTATLPAVAVTPSPMVEYASFKTRGVGEDLCLMRACDLVISIHELNIERRNDRK